MNDWQAALATCALTALMVVLAALRLRYSAWRAEKRKSTALAAAQLAPAAEGFR
jgi:hypothetical protein